MTTKMIKRNGLELSINEPCHFTVLRCKDCRFIKTYFGLARKDNIQDFEKIIDYEDKFESVIECFAYQHPH